MKKYTFIYVMIIATAFCCCNKTDVYPTTQRGNIKSSHPSFKYSNQHISIDTEGNLVFDSPEDFINYQYFIDTATLDQIQDFHADLGFTSLAGTGYNVVATNELIPDEDLYLFTFNSDYTMKVGETFFKLTEDMQTLYTLNTSNVTNEMYAEFVAENFDSEAMNRFVAGGEFASGDEDFFEFIANTQSGHDEYGGPISTPKPDAIFWGRTKKYGECDSTGHRQVIYTYWMFWFKVGHDYGYDQCP